MRGGTTADGGAAGERLWLAAIVLAGLGLRIAAIAAYPHAPESDELAYLDMARNLLAGHGLLENGNRAFYNAGYPLFVLAPVFLVCGDSLSAVRIVHLLLGAIAIVLCHRVAGAAGAGRIGRLLAAAVWAAYLPTGIYGVYLAKENLMTPLLLGALWCALRSISVPSLRVSAGGGLLFGLLALTGNAALATGGAALAALALMPVPLADRAKHVLVALVAGAVVCVPWLVRNQHVVGAPVLNTNGGFNLYLGNNPAATGFFVSIGDTPRGATWPELRKTGELRATETLKQEALAWMREHPAAFATLALRKAACFWMPPLHEGKGGNASRVETLVRALWAAQFTLMVALAVAGLASGTLRNRRTLLPWLALAGYTAAHMLFYVIFRYREPVMPLVGVLAALAVERFLAARVAAKERPVFPA